MGSLLMWYPLAVTQNRLSSGSQNRLKKEFHHLEAEYGDVLTPILGQGFSSHHSWHFTWLFPKKYTNGLLSSLTLPLFLPLLAFKDSNWSKGQEKSSQVYL